MESPRRRSILTMTVLEHVHGVTGLGLNTSPQGRVLENNRVAQGTKKSSRFSQNQNVCNRIHNTPQWSQLTPLHILTSVFTAANPSQVIPAMSITMPIAVFSLQILRFEFCVLILSPHACYISRPFM
jgi:hypothetical protein